MSLKLIYGRSGTGKTTTIYKEIKENINNNTDKYIITPEQFSFSAEKNLLNTLGKKSTVNAEVITFNRMAERVAEEVGGKNDVPLTKAGKAMLIYSILENQKNNLVFLKNSENNIELVMQTIREFKKHGIDVKAIQDATESVDSELLKAKLKDINIVYSNYEENIVNKYIDEEDKLTRLKSRLESSKIFDETEIYIDEFSGFTKQEYDIIKCLMKKAKRITIALCMDNLEKKELETDIFYWNKEVYYKLYEMAKEIGIEVEQPLYCSTNVKFKNEELVHLEQNFYSNTKQIKYDNTLKYISLNLTTNPYKQVEEVANEITKLVRDEGFQFKDIAIITKNIEEYSSLIKVILKETNNIPVFIDEKEDLNKSQIIKYILSILEIFSSNWSTESVMGYIKSGFLDLEPNEIYELENYAIKWGIRGSKWYKEDWGQEENSPNELRKKVVEPLLFFKKELDKGRNALSIRKVLYEFLDNNNIYELIQKKIKYYETKNEINLARNYKQSFEILIDVIDEMITIFQNERMTFSKFKDLLKIGLSYKKLGNIPEAIDQVILGNTERTRSSKIKVAFILGVNDGIFPGAQKKEGFLNDNEREILKSTGKEIAKGTLELLYEEQFEIYKALTTPEERLYLFFTSTDKEGKSLRPSIIISKLKRIFPNLKEQSSIIQEKMQISTKESTFKNLLSELRKASNGENIDKVWYEVYNYYLEDINWEYKLKRAEDALVYSNSPEQISKTNIKRLYGDTLKTSISKLETYSRCPYSFLLKYGLKLREKEEHKIKTIDTGSFMHDIIDTFFKRIDNVSKLEENEIPEIVEEIIEEKLNLKKNYIFTSNKKFLILTNRLKGLITKSIFYIVYQIKNSNFEVMANELEFTKKIENIEITGKIDRVDISKDGTYLRIIDYKSSNKNINLNHVFAGLQIQLLTYMNIVCEKQNKAPAGVLYFNLIEPIINSGKNLSTEEIEEKIKNEFRMKGLIVADVKIARMMDKTLEKGSSNIVPVYIDKDGNLSGSKSSAISKEDFSKLQLKIRKLIKNLSEEILSGNIDIKPKYDKKTKISACKYCEFHTICGFDEKNNCYKYIGNKTKEELLNEL